MLNLGFGAVMAILIWRAYERITRDMHDVVADNTAAMTSLRVTIEQQTHMLERLSDTVDILRHRVEILERRSEPEGAA